MTLSDPGSPLGRSPRPHALVTGSSGFLGSALVRRLAEAGVEVLGVDCRAPRQALPGGARFLQADLLDVSSLKKAFGHALPGPTGSTVYHLAAQAHVGLCRQDARMAFDLNVAGTLNVLEACRERGCAAVVYPSTGLVYRAGGADLDEDDPVAATSIYCATKLAAENLLAGYAADYGFSCTVARLGNVYGPGGNPDTVAGLLLRQARDGDPLVIRDGGPVRDFISVEDAARGLHALGSAGRPGFRILNLASGKGTSVRELGRILCQVAGRAQALRETDPAPAGKADRVVLSIARIQAWCSWLPTQSLAAGLKDALEGRG